MTTSPTILDSDFKYIDKKGNLLKTRTELTVAQMLTFLENEYEYSYEMTLKNGEKVKIDFKTAKKIKRKDWIEDYFLQGSAYANAHNVMYETNIESIAILMVDRDLLFKEFLVKNKEFESYTDKWKQRIIGYYKKHEILGRE